MLSNPRQAPCAPPCARPRAAPLCARGTELSRGKSARRGPAPGPAGVPPWTTAGAGVTAGTMKSTRSWSVNARIELLLRRRMQGAAATYRACDLEHHRAAISVVRLSPAQCSNELKGALVLRTVPKIEGA